MSVDTEALRWFVAVADGATLADTADAFHTSQPAVTRGLQRLSREFGAPLTERSGRRLRLTFTGHVLLGSARLVVRELDEAARAVLEANDPTSGTVRLGFLSPLGSWLVPELLVAFQAQRPRVRFELRHDGADRILQALVDGHLDLLLSTRSMTAGLRWEPLLEEDLVVSVSVSHRLASRRRVRVDELRAESWVVLPPGYALRGRVEEICAAAGFAPTIAFEGHDLATLYALIGAGSGIGLFPRRPGPPPEVRQVALSPRAYRPVGLVTVPGSARSPSAEAFAEMVRSRFAATPLRC